MEEVMTKPITTGTIDAIELKHLGSFKKEPKRSHGNGSANGQEEKRTQELPPPRPLMREIPPADQEHAKRNGSAQSNTPVFDQDSPRSASIEPWPVMAADAYDGLPGDVVNTIAPHSEADPNALLLQFL